MNVHRTSFATATAIIFAFGIAVACFAPVSRDSACDAAACSTAWHHVYVDSIQVTGQLDAEEGRELVQELLLRSSLSVGPLRAKAISARNALAPPLASKPLYGVELYVLDGSHDAWLCVYADKIARDRKAEDAEGALQLAKRSQAERPDDPRGIVLLDSISDINSFMVKIVMVDEAGGPYGSVVFELRMSGQHERGPGLLHVVDNELPESASSRSFVLLNEDNDKAFLFIRGALADQEIMIASSVDLISESGEVLGTGVVAGCWPDASIGEMKLPIFFDTPLSKMDWAAVVTARMRSSCELAQSVPVSPQMEHMNWWKGEVEMEVRHVGTHRK